MKDIRVNKQYVTKPVKEIIRPLYHKIRKKLDGFDLDPRWVTVQKRIKKSKKIIDLGCGNNPVNGTAVAVDRYIEPKERSFGDGQIIDIEKIEQRGINFVNSRIDTTLPFDDLEFDFAYSNHVFEHLEYPATACKEMMRIAKSGVIITPSIFAELIFGRSYHRWLVMDRKDVIFFFRKRPFEDRPFGDHPKWNQKSKKWIIEKNSNPFDMLLNYQGWYHGEEGNIPKLSKMIRNYWYSQSPLMEIVFLWEDNFKWNIYE